MLVAAVWYSRVISSVNFGPQGTLWLQLSGILGSFCLSISGLRGHSGCSCRVFSGHFVSQFRASGDTLAAAVGYSRVILSVNFGSQGTLWLQLSGVVWSFRLFFLSVLLDRRKDRRRKGEEKKEKKNGICKEI